MPWCNTCDEYVAANRDASEAHSEQEASHPEQTVSHPELDSGSSRQVEQQCATCGSGLDTSDEHKKSGIPWHFWLVVAALAGYLVWRLVDFVLSLFW